jgi:hypothetical protein
MRGLRVLALAAAVVLGGTAIGFTLGSTSRARAASGCGVESIRGAYALYGTGVAFGGPWTAHGRFTFDGAGHSTGKVVESYSGFIDDGVLDGTYTIDPECRGSATYDMQHTTRVGGPDHMYRHETHRVDLVAAAGGAKIFWILTDTHPTAVPPALRLHVDDASISVSGWFERM